METLNLDECIITIGELGCSKLNNLGFVDNNMKNDHCNAPQKLYKKIQMIVEYVPFSVKPHYFLALLFVYLSFTHTPNPNASNLTKSGYMQIIHNNI